MIDYATLLRDHVTLKCRSIDRIFLQAYVPKLQSVGQVCTFLRWQRKFKIPSSAAFGKIGDAYVKAIHKYAEEHQIPVLYFDKKGKKKGKKKKKDDKEKIARPYIEAAARAGKEGVVLIGIAQEKASAWRSRPRKGHEKKPHPHMDWWREMTYVNHFYFYLWDSEWGGAFWKTNAYAPFPIWIWLNGHEWAKRQLEKAGIGYEALDNAGYIYDLSFRQFEVSDTCVFDRPQAGRMWFEGVIRDHLDVGRPAQVALIFKRRITRSTPGTFRTRVLTEGVDPTLCCYYKASRIKQYFKEGRALRTETVICDTNDFEIGRRVCAENWHALRAVDESANRRLCDAEAADAQPAPDVATFDRVTRPSKDDGLYAAGLRFGDPRVMAVLAALVSFCHVIVGFTNHQLVERVGALLQGSRSYTCRQATYDLRRLKRKGLIVKVPHSHRYQLSSHGSVEQA